MDREIMNMVNLCFDVVNCIILLTIIFLTLKKLENSVSRNNFLFVLMTVLIYNITDCLAWTLEGNDAAWKVPALHIVTFVFFVDTPFMYISFMKFLRNILKEKYMNNRFYVICLLPCFIDMAGAFLSCYPGFFYSFSPENVYVRSPLHNIHVACIFLFYIFAVLYIVSNRKLMDRKTFLTVLSFPTLPTLCYIPQLLFYGIASVNLGLVVSMILIYVNMKKSMQTDVNQTTVFSSEYFQKRNKITFAEKLRRFLCSYGFSDNAIADSYDAMTSSRCYRPALPNDVVMNELRKGRGTQFDEKLLDVFLELLIEHGGSLIEEKEAVGS